MGGQYYFYHNDHFGTPQKLTAVNGAVVWAAKYSSFGKADVDLSSTIINNMRFPGQYFDEETELHYNLYRFYDPLTGRYLKIDPIKFVGGSNLYSYSRNNPATYADPFGLLTNKEFIETWENWQHNPNFDDPRSPNEYPEDPWSPNNWPLDLWHPVEYPALYKLKPDCDKAGWYCIKGKRHSIHWIWIE